MADNIPALSTTAASNTSFGLIGIQGSDLVSTADDAFRTLGAMLAKAYDDIGGQNTVAGTADAITVTTTTTYTALASGMVVVFKAGADNTGAATLNLDAIGAKALRKISGGTDVALVAGDLKQGRRYIIVYDSTANSASGAWVLVSLEGVPQFTTIEVGHASDTTLGRASAGDVAVEGNRIFRVGGADVPVADGGTGASTAAAAATNLGLGTGDSPTFTAVTVSSGTQGLTVTSGSYIGPASANTNGGIQFNSGTNVTVLGKLLDLEQGQLKFPATQNPSSNVNTLDDYEEGTWTPVLTFATAGNLSVVYSQQVGTYTKIGREVTVRCIIVTSTFTHTTASGGIRITGLPFAHATVSNLQSVGACYAWQGITKAGYTDVNAAISSNASLINLFASGSGVAASEITAADMPTTGTVIIITTITYQTAT